MEYPQQFGERSGDSGKDRDRKENEERRSEAVGNYLRRERIAARIEINKMAKETRINVDFINAIEKSQFDKLPPETYRRIFLKNISEYLEVDPNEVLKLYLAETGQDPDSKPVEEEKITVKPAGKGINFRIISAFFLFIIAAIIISFMRSGALFSEKDQTRQDISATTPKADSEKEAENSIVTPNIKKDSSLNGQKDKETHNVKTSDAEKSETGNSSWKIYRDEGGKEVEAVISYTGKDTIWVEAVFQGKSWKNIFTDRTKKTISDPARILLKMSKTRGAAITKGGKSRPVPGRYTIIDKKGITAVSSSRWDSFYDRKLTPDSR
ncbi:MAG: helix-turn-helix domain-containing protein [Fibrobacterota bacterium]